MGTRFDRGIDPFSLSCRCGRQLRAKFLPTAQDLHEKGVKSNEKENWNGSAKNINQKAL
jgi:hypothetical protein